MAWRRILGHEQVIEAFNRAYERQRLAHAYMFIGPAGIGKRLFAGELAKALLCEDRSGPTLEACDHCPACHLVDGGTHPDCFSAARQQEKANLDVETIRELCRKLSLKPAHGGRKVGILDDADDLNDPITRHTSANAFLKTLEEPPPGSVLILVGTGIDEQIATILSRCQIVRFDPLPEPLLIECLRTAGVTDPLLLERAARLGNGSPGQALDLADRAFWEFRSALIAGVARRPFDGVNLSHAWMQFAEGAGKDAAAQRRRAATMLRLLIDFLADALAASLDVRPRRSAPEDMLPLEALAGLGPEPLLEMLERCLEADRQIDRRLQLVLVLEALLDSIGQRLRAA